MSDSAAARPSRTRAGTPARSATFAISGLAYLTLLVTVIIVVMLIGISVAWFSWTVVLLFVQFWWIYRVHTVADADGLTAYHFIGTTTMAWDEMAGLRFPKWSTTRAVRPDGSTMRLPAVTFADLPTLAVISDGRVPDPFAAARDAAQAAQTEKD